MDITDHAAATEQKQYAPGYREACERRREQREIEAIARDLQRPATEIAQLYADLYARLKAQARVSDFLPVLVARKVRDRYRRRPIDGPSETASRAQ